MTCVATCTPDFMHCQQIFFFFCLCITNCMRRGLRVASSKISRSSCKLGRWGVVNTCHAYLVTVTVTVTFTVSQAARHFVAANVKAFKASQASSIERKMLYRKLPQWQQAHQFNSRHLTLKCQSCCVRHTHTHTHLHSHTHICSTCERNFFRQLQPGNVMGNVGRSQT